MHPCILYPKKAAAAKEQRQKEGLTNCPKSKEVMDDPIVVCESLHEACRTCVAECKKTTSQCLHIRCDKKMTRNDSRENLKAEIMKLGVRCSAPETLVSSNDDDNKATKRPRMDEDTSHNDGSAAEVDLDGSDTCKWQGTLGDFLGRHKLECPYMTMECNNASEKGK